MICVTHSDGKSILDIALTALNIYTHIKEPITMDDLANHTNLSHSNLSRLIKDEIGTSISGFIREKKIEKAQNLLKYSDYSSVEIANYLAFSSQSHFIQLFKKYVGMSPKKYHDLHYGSTWSNTLAKKEINLIKKA